MSFPPIAYEVDGMSQDGDNYTPRSAGFLCDERYESRASFDETGSVNHSRSEPTPLSRFGLQPVNLDKNQISDFDIRHMSNNVPNPPLFSHATSSNPCWQCYNDVDEKTRTFTPVRTMCWNIPVKLLSEDGTRFRHWATSQDNSHRATNIAAVLGLMFTGSSKGFSAGENSDDVREEDGEQKKGRDSARCRYRYTFPHPTFKEIDSPMFVIGYEELWNEAKDKVTVIRVWKFVFHHNYSDSKLLRQLLDETARAKNECGIAHSQTGSRKKHLVEEQKHNKIMTGGICKMSPLEYFSGTQYVTLTTEMEYLTALKVCGGVNIAKNKGNHTCEWSKLPGGLCQQRITFQEEVGGLHPLSPEYQFNARREMALKAWQTEMDDTPCDVHPDYNDPKNYFNDDYSFMIPGVSFEKKGFFFCIDPSATNIFDLTLPRPVYGNVLVGVDLLDLYEAEHLAHSEARFYNVSSAALFKNFMTGKDQEQIQMEIQASEAVVTFDAIGITESERKDLRHYGELDSQNAYIVEPRQCFKEIQMQTRKIISDLVEPWRASQRAEEEKLLSKVSKTSSDVYYERMQQTTEDHAAVMKDVICLHLSRIEQAFDSKTDRESIPGGYCAMYDYLKSATSKLPNGTASIAWAYDFSLLGIDTSVFAQVFQFQGEFFESQCFIDGRDRRIMDEIFFHLFEQYADVTFVLLLCGTKGNGKSLRTERAMGSFPPNWTTMGGPASAKAGMNGQSDSTNGKNVIYDEMIDDLCDSEGTDRLEYWKQIVLKREYTYNRTIQHKNPDGTDSHKTMKLRTPHFETHCICTNYGMAFTKDGNPGDTKFAMIDRSIAHLVRSIGQNSRTDSEYESHKASPEGARSLEIFRLFVCLVGATRLSIKGVPAFRPNVSYANHIFDHLDKQVIVKEYNLPFRSARKCLKREENLVTMCCMSAVASVFMYKQTAIEWECGTLDQDGKPQPFKWTLLYDVVRQLLPSPEQIFMAWSQSLDYNIGTASHSMSAMTALCESFKVQVQDWLKKPRSDFDFDQGTARNDLESGVSHGSQGGQDSSCAAQKAKLEAERKFNDENKFQPLMTDGATLQERRDMLTGFERQRRATSMYRHECGINGNSELVFSDPVRVIEKIMSSIGQPKDVGANAVDPICMPIYSSCIIASAVQISNLYNPTALHSWCRDELFHSLEKEPIKNLIAPSSHLNFRSWQRDGAVKWDAAWLRSESSLSGGWSNYAKETLKTFTCKLFDISHNSMRDMLFLLSTKDNCRRITENPTLPSHMWSSQAFVNPNGDTAMELSYSVKIKGVKDVRNKEMTVEELEEKDRHPYSGVHPFRIQRRLDGFVKHGRLPAVMPLISNKTVNDAPLRIVDSITEKSESRYVELNTTAAFDHTKMVAEAVIRCSMHPGMHNVQEDFGTNDGPRGFTAEKAPPANATGGHATRLPYSFDIVGIAITLDAMSRFYDPYVKSHFDLYNSDYCLLGNDFKLCERKHMCLRYVGFEGKAMRFLISNQVEMHPNPAFEDVVLKSDNLKNLKENRYSKSVVSLMCGHTASDKEVEDYIKARQGSRATAEINGPLFSMSTWQKHGIKTMKERGMITSMSDVACKMMKDSPYNLRVSVNEKASIYINRLIDQHPDLLKAEEPRSSDDDLDEFTFEKVKMQRVKDAREKLCKTIPLPQSIEHLRNRCRLNVKTESCIPLTYHNQKEVIDATDMETELHDWKEQADDPDSEYNKKKEADEKKKAKEYAKRKTETGSDLLSGIALPQPRTKRFASCEIRGRVDVRSAQ